MYSAGLIKPSNYWSGCNGMIVVMSISYSHNRVQQNNQSNYQRPQFCSKLDLFLLCLDVEFHEGTFTYYVQSSHETIIVG